MATTLVPYFILVEQLDQAGEDALALTLTGATINSVVIRNTTLGKTRFWDGSAFTNAPLYNPDGGSWSGGGATDWADVTNKPSTFAPSAHNHDESYSVIGHTHANYAPLIPQEFTFIGAITAWTNKNVALQEFLNTNQRRLTLDLTNATQFRIIMNVTTQGVSGSVTGVQYSTDSGTTFRGLDNGNSGSNSTVTLSDLGTGSKVTSWTNLAAGAKADVILRIAGSGGDGAADPAFSNISIQLK